SNAGFVATLMVYFGLTLAYSLSLKRRMIVDIWVLAGLYTIRIFAGGVASSVALSPWLLTFAMFLFLGLAAIKRQAELIDGANRSQSTLNGRAYMADDMPVIRGIAITAGYASVLVFALYVNSLASAKIYLQPEFL
ncbi:MAG: prenyltransferase, partial [Paracoccaceae bacterium]|nr:prenyltransferase [Paracoccaceae bacterium]